MKQIKRFIHFFFPLSFAGKIKALEQEKRTALAIFTTTLKNIDKLNAEVEKEILTTTKKMEELKEFHSQLHTHQEANNAIVTKINVILNDSPAPVTAEVTEKPQ